MPGHRRHDDPITHPRRDRMDAERVSDPYRARGKRAEPGVCPACGVMVRHGRWQWGTAPAGAEEHLCPACVRIRDRLPAGQLTLSGEFFRDHHEEILRLVRNVELAAHAEHPLERIIEVKDEPDHTLVTFTDSHLVHRVGKALCRAYHGELDARHTDEGDLVRVAWRR